MKKSIILYALTLILPAGAAYAGDETDKPTRLDEAVVSATRTERKTAEIPAGVSTVTEDDIDSTRMFTLKDALTGITGVQSESRNGGYDSRLIIRGAGLKARYGIREIMVLLDGVPVTDPDGLSRLDFVDTQLVERIDVVRGPNSTLYGANAAGGVVNIITKSPFEEEASATVGLGSHDTRMASAIYGNKVGDTYFLISGSRRSTDSWRAWNEFSTTQGNLKIGRAIDGTSSIEAAIQYTEADIQLPGTLTREQFSSDITQLTAEPWRHSGRYSHSLFTSLRYRKEAGAVEIKPTVYFQKWDHYHPVTALINEGGAEVAGADVQVDIKHTIAGMAGVLTAGATGQRDDAAAKKYTYRDYATNGGGRIIATLSDEKGSLAEDDSDTVTKGGVFVQESLRPSSRWIIDLGVRYDAVRFDISEEKYIAYNYTTGQYAASPASTATDKGFDAVSPRAGAVYKLTESWSLYAAASTGFQTPQSSEISVNPGLDCSKTYNYETGVKARSAAGHSLDLSLFSASVKDEIVQTIEPGNISSYSNAGETTKNGVEVSGRLLPARGLTIGGSYTYSGFHFKEFIEPVRQGGSYVYYDRSGNSLPYIPRNQYSLFMLYKSASGFRMKLDANTWGEYYVDNANSEKYEGYDFITNALVGFEKGNVEATFDVYNVFDQRYAMEVTKDTTGVLRFKPGAPRTWLAKLSYKF